MAYDPIVEAQEDLQIISECLDRISDRSRVPMHLCAAALAEARREMITCDPHYQEAAWRVMSGELKKYPTDDAEYTK
jgi:hypothetical protein